MSLKNFVLLACLFVTTEALTQAEDSNKNIVNQIRLIGDSDKRDRHFVDSIQKTDPFNTQLINSIWLDINKKDSIRSKKLFNLIRQYGTNKMFSNEEVLLNVFLIVQHSNVADLKKFISFLKNYSKNNRYPQEYYAMHIDRLAMQTGRYQLYGTQFGGDYTGKLQIWPIKKILEVNSRRKKLRIGTIEDYAKKYRISFATPTIDSFHRKVVVSGLIYDDKFKKNIPVRIYSQGGKKLGETNSDGAFRLIIPRRTFKKGIVFFSNKYVIKPIYQYSPDIDIYFLYFEIKNYGDPSETTPDPAVSVP